jgi:gluconolactonase
MKRVLLASILAAAFALPASAALKEGDAAPAFKAQASQAGKAFAFSLKDALKKGPVVVYFYPSAYTGGCNIQAHTFAVNHDKFVAAGATVVGVSLDSIARLNDFSADPNYCAGKFPVVADADGQIARSYDLQVKEIAAGKKDTRGIEIDHATTERTTFVVTPDGKVAASVGGLTPEANVNKALEYVQQLAQRTNGAGGATKVATAIPGVVAAGTRIELIKDGFTGTEGPVVLPDGSLIFTETTANRITRIAPDGSTSTFIDNSNGANGLGFNAAGDLYAVQVLKPRVGIVYPAAHARTLADQFEGKPFGRPNDLVVDRKGGVYFTDSGAPPRAPGSPAPAAAEQSVVAKPAVYHITPSGELQRIAADIERPNGIQLSPDEKTLYVANTAGEHVLAFDIGADGRIGAHRNFAKLEGWRKTDTGASSGADGLAVDASGRLYVASTAGIQVFSSKGEALGVIALPRAPQNLAFAGTDKKTLYVVGRGAAYKIPLLAEGYGGRAK